MTKARTRPYVPRVHDPDEVVEVPHADHMDDETFLKHIEHRHAAETGIEGTVHRNALDAWLGNYRTFHRRLHDLARPGQHDHTHEEY